MALAAKQQVRDEDSERIAQVVGEFEKLKADNARLRDRNVEGDKMVAVRDGEIAAMSRELANLRYRLSFFQNYAVKLSSSFNIIMSVMDEAQKDASEAAQQQADVEQKHGGSELPAIDIPIFMQRMREENGIGQS